jgi:phosphate starvation-inducible PhoH-like protein
MAKAENITKRVPKNEINYQIKLNTEQKLAKAGVFQHDVSVILGKAASGKTQFAVSTALDLFNTRQINKIIISRPIMPDKLGFMPGDVKDKMAAQIAPILQCMYDVLGKEVIDKMFDKGEIQILPVDHMKGITYQHACVIIDEAQDCTYEDFELCLTRLGKTSKLIFVGSEEQVNSKITKLSCIKYLVKLEGNELVNFHRFTSNHRNEVIFKILEYLKS